MKLVRRLTAYLLLVFCGVFAIDAWRGISDHLSLFAEDIRHDHLVLGEAFSAAVEETWHARGRERAFELIRAANAREEGVRIRIVVPGPAGVDGAVPERIRGDLAQLRSGHAPLQLRDRQGGEAVFLTYVPLSIDEVPGTVLEIAEPLAHERAYAAAHLRRSLASAGIAALACGFVAWLVGVRLVGRPIARIVAKARRTGDGDFSQPLEISQRDELAQLASEMNAMAEHLDAATRRVAKESAGRIAALEQLRHADRLTTVGKLASGLAHELGTPLNVVSGRAKMIASGEATRPDEVVTCARIVGQQAERMTAIVRQLLDFARRRSPEKSPTDLAQLARQTASLLEPLAGRRGVRLLCTEAADPLLAPLDPSQIQQALTNLVVNGIQATKPAGSVRIRAHTQTLAADPVSLRAAGGYAVLEVSDDGEGIPAERLSVIFDPFFTTKGVGEGTGLGLSVAHGIVQEHGGWIEVESAPGRGSCFGIWLPAGTAGRDGSSSSRTTRR